VLLESTQGAQSLARRAVHVLEAVSTVARDGTRGHGRRSLPKLVLEPEAQLRETEQPGVLTSVKF
jgi:hypothetical protein